MKRQSTRDQISVASTVNEVRELLSKARSFKNITPRTLKRIELAAERRLAVLEAKP